MGIKMIKKAGEALVPLKTFKTNMIYVPEFKNERGLQALVADIHAMYKNGEEGWDGDACWSILKNVVDLSDYPYLIAIGGSNMVFAFQSKTDRDCIVSDYLPDPDAIS